MGKSKTNESSARWRTVAALAIGIAIGWATIATPAGGHVTQSVAHVRKHMANFFFTKAESDARSARVAYDALEPITTSPLNTFVAEWTHTITPGVAGGGVKVDASVIIQNPTAGGCIAVVKAFVDNTQITTTQTKLVGANETAFFPLTGVGNVTTVDPKTVEVEVDDVDLCGVGASGDVASSWFPVGPTGS